MIRKVSDENFSSLEIQIYKDKILDNVELSETKLQNSKF